jgi:hypothetical protein
MMRRRDWLMLPAGLVLGQEPEDKPVEFLCPMDADIRQKGPGKCPRCGMKLVAGLPDPLEYGLELSLRPRQPKPGQRVKLRFAIRHPETGRAVSELELVHERVFHLFLISENLEHFAHEHPEPVGPGVFELDWVFPVGGMWRLLADFYPTHGTPQLIARSVLLAGKAGATRLLDGELRGENLTAQLKLTPGEPVAGEKTLLQYSLTPRASFEPFLGAMGHMLIASEDLIDLIHTHPFLVDGGLAKPPEDVKLVQFNVLFPRPGRYRVWAQFQRAGVVNTIATDVMVKDL